MKHWESELRLRCSPVTVADLHCCIEALERNHAPFLVQHDLSDGTFLHAEDPSWTSRTARLCASSTFVRSPTASSSLEVRGAHGPAGHVGRGADSFGGAVNARGHPPTSWICSRTEAGDSRPFLGRRAPEKQQRAVLQASMRRCLFVSRMRLKFHRGALSCTHEPRVGRPTSQVFESRSGQTSDVKRRLYTVSVFRR